MAEILIEYSESRWTITDGHGCKKECDTLDEMVFWVKEILRGGN